LIFYTLQGPAFELEIYEDKIRLVKKTWTGMFSTKPDQDTFVIDELSKFEITVPKFLFFSGKLHWETFKGETATFRFSTNPLMVKKIETYLQKRVIKNHQAIHKVKELPQPQKKKKQKNKDLAA
jgi:hypothetical protein